MGALPALFRRRAFVRGEDRRPGRNLSGRLGDLPARNGCALGPHRAEVGDRRGDAGCAFGALLAGIVADLLGIAWAIAVIAGLTFASGTIVALRMSETLKRE